VNQSYFLPRQGEIRVTDDPFTLECHQQLAIMGGLLEDGSREETDRLAGPISKRNDLVEHWAIGSLDNLDVNPLSVLAAIAPGHETTLLRPQAA
jgi:hypothetical protein